MTNSKKDAIVLQMKKCIEEKPLQISNLINTEDIKTLRKQLQAQLDVLEPSIKPVESPTRYVPYVRTRKRKKEPPQYVLASSDEYFVTGSVKQGCNADNIFRRFKKCLVEKQQQIAKSKKEADERRAKANKKQEDDAAEDK